MKIYTQTYDLATASPQRFWVTPFSDFKIGIKLLSKGELLDKDFTVKAGEVVLTPDEDKIDGFTIFTIKSGNTGFVDYIIEVEGVTEKLKLTQIVTDSTVFDIDAEGEGVPANLSVDTLTVNDTFTIRNDAYTVITGATDANETDSGVLDVKGTNAKLRVGGNSDINAVRINANGTTPNIQVGKMGTSDLACAALSCDTSGHGLLILDGVSFDAATLSATYTANQILEGLV